MGVGASELESIFFPRNYRPEISLTVGYKTARVRKLGHGPVTSKRLAQLLANLFVTEIVVLN